MKIRGIGHASSGISMSRFAETSAKTRMNSWEPRGCRLRGFGKKLLSRFINVCLAFRGVSRLINIKQIYMAGKLLSYICFAIK